MNEKAIRALYQQYYKQRFAEDLQLRQKIDALFRQAAKEAGQAVGRLGLNGPISISSISQLPHLDSQLRQIVNTAIFDRYVPITESAIDKAWGTANRKSERLEQIVARTSHAKNTADFINNEALNAFKNRIDRNGQSFSGRVWKLTDGYNEQINKAVVNAIANGVPASQIAEQIQQYVKNPLVYKKALDEHGNTTIKIELPRNTGRGVYRSPYQNAMRLARTEVNMAYLEADHERWADNPSILGYEIRLSNNHTLNGKPFTDICDELQGEYPKDYHWVGWHPQCRCIMIPIMEDPIKAMERRKAIREGRTPESEAPKPIDKMPEQFNKWVENNSERLQAARERGTEPYWARDERAIGNTQQTAGNAKPAVEPKPQNEVTQSSSTIEALEKRGYTSYISQEEYEKSAMNGFDMHTFDKQFSELIESNGMVMDRRVIDGHNGKANFNLYYTYGGDTYQLARNFEINKAGEKEVYHALFKLPADLQGKGISKQVFRQLYKQYQVAGVQRISVTANIDVGGYTWARYGFTATPAEATAIVENSKVSKSIKLKALKVIRRYEAIYPGAKEFPMNDIVTELGKETAKRILKGSFWHGSINLNNQAQRELFESYLGL